MPKNDSDRRNQPSRNAKHNQDNCMPQFKPHPDPVSSWFEGYGGYQRIVKFNIKLLNQVL